jgi:hypothetical protein
MAAIRTMTTLNDKPLTAIREVGSVHALTDVTGTSPLPLLLLLLFLPPPPQCRGRESDTVGRRSV